MRGPAPGEGIRSSPGAFLSAAPGGRRGLSCHAVLAFLQSIQECGQLVPQVRRQQVQLAKRREDGILPQAQKTSEQSELCSDGTQRVGFEPTVPEVHLISSQARYDHFDTAACMHPGAEALGMGLLCHKPGKIATPNLRLSPFKTRVNFSGSQS